MLDCFRICRMGIHTIALKKGKPTKISSSSLDLQPWSLQKSNPKPHEKKEFAAMKMDSNQFKRIFEAFDKNVDGKISNFELSGLLSTYAITKKAEETLRAIMDGNGDGFMYIDEFMEAIGETGSQSELHDLRDAFAVFDIDSDGKISAEDLQLVLVSLGCNKYGPEECSRMIKGVDQNGDGFVDFQEFRLMMTKGASIQCLLNL